MGPTWGPPGSCRPQVGPMWATWTLLSGMVCVKKMYQLPKAPGSHQVHSLPHCLQNSCVHWWPRVSLDGAAANLQNGRPNLALSSGSLIVDLDQCFRFHRATEIPFPNARLSGSAISVVTGQPRAIDFIWFWVSWGLRSPTTRLFVRQFIKQTITKISKLRITGLGESTSGQWTLLTKGQ